MAFRSQEPGDAPAGPARARRLLFVLITLGLVYCAIETLAFVGFWIIDREPFSFGRLQAERNTLLDVPLGAAEERRADGEEAMLSRFVVHPYLGLVPMPKQVPRLAGGGHRTLYQGPEAVTEQLARMGDGDEERAGEAVVVAIVGGSVAAGFAKSGTLALAAQLEASPSFAGKEIRFAILAWSGYKQPQQLMTITYLLGLGAEFDLIINIDGFNEVALHPAENAKTNTFAAFPRHWYYYVTELPQRLTSEYDYLNLRRAKLAATYSGTGLRHWILGNLAWRLHDHWLGEAIQAARQAVVESKPEKEPSGATGPEREYRSYPQLMSHLVSIWKESSLQLDRISRANDIAYFHFLQPNQYVAESKPMDEIERRHSLDPEHPYRRGAVVGYPMLIAEGADLASRGVRFTDLTQLFSETRERLYIDDCCHFSARGNEMMAEAIAHAILDHFASEASRPTSHRQP